MPITNITTIHQNSQLNHIKKPPSRIREGGLKYSWIFGLVFSWAYRYVGLSGYIGSITATEDCSYRTKAICITIRFIISLIYSGSVFARYLIDIHCWDVYTINHYSIRNDIHTQIQFTGRLNFVSVELPKFNKQLPELSTLTEKIMYCLRYQDTFTSVPEELSCQELDKMFKISNFAAMDYNEQTEYLQEFLAEIDARSAMRYAKEQAQKEGRVEGIAEGIAEGLAEGLAEGRAEGLAEGRAEGIAEGRAEGIAEARTMVAASMKAEGLSTAIIAKCTGLSIEEIEKL